MRFLLLLCVFVVCAYLFWDITLIQFLFGVILSLMLALLRPFFYVIYAPYYFLLFLFFSIGVIFLFFMYYDFSFLSLEIFSSSFLAFYAVYGLFSAVVNYFLYDQAMVESQ